jgi:hypothetical protein
MPNSSFMKSNCILKASAHHLLRRLLIVASVSLIGSICLGQSVQPPTDSAPPAMIDSQSPSVAMTFADGKSLAIRSKKSRFALVAANASEVVNIRVRVSSSANGVAAAQCLDGGALSTGAENITLDADGLGSFQFRAGAKPGLYRVVVGAGGAIAILQFWVIDPSKPNSRPSALQAH